MGGGIVLIAKRIYFETLVRQDIGKILANDIVMVAPHLTVVTLLLPLLVAVSAWVDVLGAWMQPKGAGGA